jgi:hypothetical protein
MDGTTFVKHTLLTPDPISLDWAVVGIADLTQDGHADILWRNQATGHIAYWQLNGSASFQHVLLDPNPVALSWTAPTMA